MLRLHACELAASYAFAVVAAPPSAAVLAAAAVLARRVAAAAVLARPVAAVTAALVGEGETELKLDETMTG